MPSPVRTVSVSKRPIPSYVRLSIVSDVSEEGLDNQRLVINLPA